MTTYDTEQKISLLINSLKLSNQINISNDIKRIIEMFQQLSQIRQRIDVEISKASNLPCGQKKVTLKELRKDVVQRNRFPSIILNIKVPRVSLKKT